MTLECGQHEDPRAPDVGHRAIVNTLAHLGLIDAADPAPAARIEALRLCEVVDRTSAGDAFARRGRASTASAPASASARAPTARRCVAPFDGVVVFPNADAQVGHEWFYLARDSTRWAGAAKGAGSRR